MMATKFWENVPKLTPKMTEWQPGTTRSYIPVATFGRQENVKPAGNLGEIKMMDGDRRVSFIVRGKKTEGTKL
jgi:hypothetical protein